MAARMDRYKKNESNGSRSSRNKNLYNTMYSFDRYSNIEGVASLDDANIATLLFFGLHLPTTE